MKKKRITIKWIFKHNKGLILLLTLLFSLAVIANATYAWELFQDEKENKFGSGMFKVVLKENFMPNYIWSPGTSVTKEVYVQNTGDYPAFVRLSAEEFLLNFDMDIIGDSAKEGTGNVKQFDISGVAATIKNDNVATWKIGEYYDKSATSERFKSIETVPSTIGTSGKGLIYEKDQAFREISDLSYLTLHFGDVIDYDNSLTGAYWKYDQDGFFYYSERLDPGKSTTLFLKNVFLSSSLPNRLKNSLYKIRITMDGNNAFYEGLADWSHTAPTDPIYLMLKDKVTNT